MLVVQMLKPQPRGTESDAVLSKMPTLKDGKYCFKITLVCVCLARLMERWDSVLGTHSMEIGRASCRERV